MSTRKEIELKTEAAFGGWLPMSSLPTAKHNTLITLLTQYGPISGNYIDSYGIRIYHWEVPAIERIVRSIRGRGYRLGDYTTTPKESGVKLFGWLPR